jgi:hypothetical protein
MYDMLCYRLELLDDGCNPDATGLTHQTFIGVFVAIIQGALKAQAITITEFPVLHHAATDKSALFASVPVGFDMKYGCCHLCILLV